MNRLLETAYHALPAPIQDVAVSLYGFKLKLERTGQAFDDEYALLMASQHYSPAQMHELISQRLRDRLQVAAQAPAYRCLRGKDLQGDPFSLLQNIPVTSKEDLRRDGDRYLNPSVSGSQLITLFTSGSTGTPLKIVCDRDSRRRHYAFFARVRANHGLSDRSVRATFLGRILMDAHAQKPPFWRHDRAQRNVLFSSYHLNDAYLPAYIDELARLQPDEVFGYPSSLYAVAKFALERGASLPRPKLLMTTAETLFGHQREALEQAFGAPVTDQYGSTEMSHFAVDCSAGGKHLHSEHGIVEILDDNNQPLPDGQIGRAICTSFINRAMPVLRYDIGDTFAIERDRCSCGLPYPRITQLLGRADDVVYTPAGTPAGRLDPIFKGLDSNIKEAQIIQEEDLSLSVNLVLADDIEAVDTSKIARELAHRVSAELPVSFNYVDAIPRGANGKFKAVLSRASVTRRS